MSGILKLIASTISDSGWYIDYCPLYGRCPLLGEARTGSCVQKVLDIHKPHWIATFLHMCVEKASQSSSTEKRRTWLVCFHVFVGCMFCSFIWNDLRPQILEETQIVPTMEDQQQQQLHQYAPQAENTFFIDEELPILLFDILYIELEEPPPVSCNESSRIAVNGYLNETFCRISIWKC